MKNMLSRGPMLALMALLSACAPKKHDPNGRKILRLALGDDVKSADPANFNDQISAEFAGHIFEGLMSFTYLGPMGQVAPTLAEGMPVFKNRNRTVTFRIRQNVLFQDDPAFPNGQGRAVVAQDFVYTIKRIADPRTISPNWWMFEGVVEGLNEWRTALEKAPADQRDALFEKPIKGLHAPDARTFVMQLTKPYPQLLHVLSMPGGFVVAREVAEKYGPEIINHPVGTGPFRLKSWIRGSKLIVERNPKYRADSYPNVGTDDERKRGLLQAAGKAVPFVDEIQWDIIKEEQPRWLKFKNGDLDLSGIPKDYFLDVIDGNGQLKPELQNQGWVLYKEPELTSWWLEFNLKDPILGKNLKLRQAIAHAFDRARAMELLYNNRGILAVSPVPPALEGGADNAAYPYTYNVERAKKLLAEAGYPEGKGLPELNFDLRGPGITNRQLGELFRDNMAAVGIKIATLANSFPEALEKAKSARFQIMLSGWAADYPDPENFLQNFYGPNAAPGPNSANFNDKEFDALYQQIRTQLPGPQRKAAIQKMVAILQRELPGVWFYHAVLYQLSTKQLKHYKPQLFLTAIGKYVDLER